jgi:hypothetical protein
MSDIAKAAIQPYELFGVTASSSIQDIRKAYFKLSLLCHPDKGGNADDMRTIHSAYQWILQQHTTVRDRTDGEETYEEKEDSFQKFLRDQSQLEFKIIPFDDIVKEAIHFERHVFNDLYNRYKTSDDTFIADCIYQLVFSNLKWVYIDKNEVPSLDNIGRFIEHSVKQYEEIQDRGWAYASYEGGYGNVMVESQSSIDYQPTIDGNQAGNDFGSAQMTLYQEPRVYNPPTNPTTTPVEVPKQMDDYSLDYGPMDYKEAYKYTNCPFEELEKEAKEMARKDIFIALEKMLLEREMHDMSMS